MFEIQGGSHLVSCPESSIIKLYQAVYQECRYSRAGNLDVRGALIFECSSYVEGPVVRDSGWTSPCFLFRIKHNKVISSVISSVVRVAIYLVSCHGED